MQRIEQKEINGIKDLLTEYSEIFDQLEKGQNPVQIAIDNLFEGNIIDILQVNDNFYFILNQVCKCLGIDQRSTAVRDIIKRQNIGPVSKTGLKNQIKDQSILKLNDYNYNKMIIIEEDQLFELTIRCQSNKCLVFQKFLFNIVKSLYTGKLKLFSIHSKKQRDEIIQIIDEYQKKTQEKEQKVKQILIEERVTSLQCEKQQNYTNEYVLIFYKNDQILMKQGIHLTKQLILKEFKKREDRHDFLIFEIQTANAKLFRKKLSQTLCQLKGINFNYPQKIPVRKIDLSFTLEELSNCVNKIKQELLQI